jgi:anti-sigma regulatory factor (Ser/Thr protein kinase)
MEQLRAWRLCDDADLIRVGVALQEALVNAIEHGYLEVHTAMTQDDFGSRQRGLQQRRRQPPYSDRQVYVRAHLTAEAATITIRDDGPGFDPTIPPDRTDPDNLLRMPGRGWALIRTFLDDVQFNDVGNEITLVKRKKL